MARQSRTERRELLRYQAWAPHIRGESSGKNTCYKLCVIYFWATVVLSTTPQAEIHREGCSKASVQREGCCTTSAVAVKWCWVWYKGCDMTVPEMSKSAAFMHRETAFSSELRACFCLLCPALGALAGTKSSAPHKQQRVLKLQWSRKDFLQLFFKSLP